LKGILARNMTKMKIIKVMIRGIMDDVDTKHTIRVKSANRTLKNTFASLSPFECA
jgi:phosphopantetheine adenylyltransferase